MEDSERSYSKKKLGYIVVLIELIISIITIIYGLGIGFDQISGAIQIIGYVVVLTVASLIFEAVYGDYEERRNEQHQGTYHEIKT